MIKANVLLQEKGPEMEWEGSSETLVWGRGHHRLPGEHALCRARAADVHYKRSDMHRLMFAKDHFS